MDFWARVPLKYRIKKELYDDYLFERLFKKFNIEYKRKIKKNIIKLLIKKMFPKFIINVFKNSLLKTRKKKEVDNLQINEVLRDKLKTEKVYTNCEFKKCRDFLHLSRAKLLVWRLKK